VINPLVFLNPNLPLCHTNDNKRVKPFILTNGNG